MITCDVVRAALAAIMALPGMPLGVLVALLPATTMYTPGRRGQLRYYPQHSNGE